MSSAELGQLVDLLGSVQLDLLAPLEQWRSGYDALGRFGSLVPDVAVEDDVLGGVAVQRHVPGGGAGHRGAVVHLHGGGYLIGSPTSHAALASHLAAALGCPVVVPDYRLAPEHPIDAGLEDALAVWGALLASGLDPAAVALSGDSAGGGLVLRCAIALRDQGAPMPAALALQSPWTDLSCTLPSIEDRAERDVLLSPVVLRHWAAVALGGASAMDPTVSPLHASLGGLPPMLVHVGGREVLHDDSIELAARARAAGVSVQLDERDELIHVWHLFAGALPEADASIEDLASFLRQHLSRPS